MHDLTITGTHGALPNQGMQPPRLSRPAEC